MAETRTENDTNDEVPSTRVLRQRAKVHKQKYARRTRVYRIFGEPNRLVEHQGYISDFDAEVRYYNVISRWRQ